MYQFINGPTLAALCSLGLIWLTESTAGWFFCEKNMVFCERKTLLAG
jgi:hypothetical protein